MSINCRRTCGYCHRNMEEGTGDDRIKHKTHCCFEQKEVQDKDSGLMVNNIRINVEGGYCEDMCDKCALEFTLTFVKRELSK